MPMSQTSINDWFAEETIDLIAKMIKQRTSSAPLTILDLFNTLSLESSLSEADLDLIKDSLESVYDQVMIDFESSGETLFSPELQKLIASTRALILSIGVQKMEKKDFWIPMIQWIKIKISPDYRNFASLSQIEKNLLETHEFKLDRVYNKSTLTSSHLVLEDGKIHFSMRLVNTLNLAKIRAEEEKTPLQIKHLLYALIVSNLNNDIEIVRRIDIRKFHDMFSELKDSDKKQDPAHVKTILEIAIELAKEKSNSCVDFQHLGLALLDYDDPLIETFLTRIVISKSLVERSLNHCLAVNTNPHLAVTAVELKDFYS